MRYRFMLFAILAMGTVITAQAKTKPIIGGSLRCQPEFDPNNPPFELDMSSPDSSLAVAVPVGNNSSDKASSVVFVSDNLATKKKREKRLRIRVTLLLSAKSNKQAEVSAKFERLEGNGDFKHLPDRGVPVVIAIPENTADIHAVRIPGNAAKSYPQTIVACQRYKHEISAEKVHDDNGRKQVEAVRRQIEAEERKGNSRGRRTK